MTRFEKITTLLVLIITASIAVVAASIIALVELPVRGALYLLDKKNKNEEMEKLD